MEQRVRICSNPKRAFPGVANLIHEPISAALAHYQSDLFIDIFFQFLGVQMLDLLKQAL
jgi:hypothetical protein